MATIDITVVQGALPLKDDTLVLRVTLDNSADVIELTGVELQSVLDAGVDFLGTSTQTSAPELTLDAGAAVAAGSVLSADASVGSTVNAAVDLVSTSSLTADASVGSSLSTIEITVVQGALPAGDNSLVLRVTLDDGTEVDLTGVEVQSILVGAADFSAAAAATASPSLLLSGGADTAAASVMTADGALENYVDGAADFSSALTTSAAAEVYTGSQIGVTVVRGGLRYGEAYTLRVELDSGATSDLTGVELEPGTGEAAVDVVDPVTTSNSIFYQVSSGTPATGQQIWHDDSPNTVVFADGTVEQTVVRNFNAQIWDTDYTWGAVTEINALAIGNIDAELPIAAQSTFVAAAEFGGEVTASVSIPAQATAAFSGEIASPVDAATDILSQSSVTAAAELSGEQLAATDFAAASVVTADPATLISAGAAFASTATMSANGSLAGASEGEVAFAAVSTVVADAELITGLGAGFSAQSAITADPAMDVIAGAGFSAQSSASGVAGIDMITGVGIVASSAATASGESSASLDAGLDIVVQSTTTTQAAMDLRPAVAIVATSVYQAGPAMDLLTRAAFAALSSATFDSVGAVEVERGYLEAYSVHVYPALSCYTKVEPR